MIGNVQNPILRRAAIVAVIPAAATFLFGAALLDAVVETAREMGRQIENAKRVW